MSESVITKNALAYSFKNLMEHKPFDKITIADITSGCGLNRQTFYYHFRDKYELLNWVYFNEVLREFSCELNLENWTEHMSNALSTIQKNIKFYRNALNTAYGGEFREYFFSTTQRLLLDAVHRLSGGHDVEESNCVFVADFFAYGISGVVIQWICHDSKTSLQTIIDHIEHIINDCISECSGIALRRYFKN